jgi:ribonuclease D
MHRPFAPSKEEIASLEALGQLGMENIVLVSTPPQALQALQELNAASVLGFDTESKPTFVKDEVSSGPHVVQFSTPSKAYVFQLHDDTCRNVVCQLLTSPKLAKVGFGLAGDHAQIQRTLGVQVQHVLDLNTVFREKGYIKELGVRAAVAVMFKRRFVKSRKATTSNWANRQLSESQIIYAANDAWAAIQIYESLRPNPD